MMEEPAKPADPADGAIKPTLGLGTVETEAYSERTCHSSTSFILSSMSKKSIKKLLCYSVLSHVDLHNF